MFHQNASVETIKMKSPNIVNLKTDINNITNIYNILN